MAIYDLLTGFGVALGVAVGGVAIIMAVETIMALANKDRRANILRRGFKESFHQMLS